MLAYLDMERTLHPEDGAGFAPVQLESWASCVDALFSLDVQLFTPPLEWGLGDWLACALSETQDTKADREHKQYCDVHLAGSSIVGITVYRQIGRAKRARHLHVCRRWKLDNRAWDIAGSTPAENRGWLARLRQLYETLGSGVQGTPGKCGLYTIMQEWDAGRYGRMPRPNLALIQALQEHAVGGRIGLYADPGRVYESAWELDIKNAYAWAARRLPVGTPSYLSGAGSCSAKALLPAATPAMPNSTWYAECLIAIDAPLPQGDVFPFGIKGRGKDGEEVTKWPTDPGYYRVWLWREEAERIQQREAEGAPIRLVAMGEAWVWHEWTEVLAPWVVRMERARREAPSKAVAQLVKQCIVAGIGRLGVAYERKRLIPAEEAGEGDVLFQTPSADGAGLWYIRTEHNDHGMPKHWQAYVMMLVNLRVYDALHAGYLRGMRPLGSLVDSVIFARQPHSGTYSKAPQTGEWGIRHAHYWTGYAAGHFLDLEKQRMPGVTEGHKARLYRSGEAPPDRAYGAKGLALAALRTAARVSVARHLAGLERVGSFYQAERARQNTG